MYVMLYRDASRSLGQGDIDLAIRGRAKHSRARWNVSIACPREHGSRRST
jgi:hypothetical protein